MQRPAVLRCNDQSARSATQAPASKRAPRPAGP